jgi:hypothetical protein
MTAGYCYGCCMMNPWCMCVLLAEGTERKLLSHCGGLQACFDFGVIYLNPC